jgi:uncharacterized membrane protein YeiH
METPDWVQLVGAVVFAMSGALAAVRQRMDPLGVMVIAVVTAIGGGTIRDVLLDRHPVFWIEDPSHLVVSMVAAVFTLVYVRFRRPPKHSLAIADALGLALFTIVGAHIAEQKVVNPILVVLMGTMTGVAGGVIRDVLSAQIPLIFRRGELYATAAIAGASIYVLLLAVAMARPVAAIVGMMVIAGLRVAAIVWGLHLPEIRVRHE